MAQRKTATRYASSIGRKGIKKSILRNRSSVSHAALAPEASTEDLIAVNIQREEAVGPDFDPAYFSLLEALIENDLGPVTGEFKVVSG